MPLIEFPLPEIHIQGIVCLAAYSKNLKSVYPPDFCLFFQLKELSAGMFAGKCT